MSYDQAMEAFDKTFQHTKEAEKWEKRTVDVPPGATPDAVIETNQVKITPIPGLEVSAPKVNPIKVDVPLSKELIEQSPLGEAKKVTPGAEPQEDGGWDWMSGNAQQEQQPAAKPKPKTMTTVFDASKGGMQKPAVRPAVIQNNESEVNLASDDSGAAPSPGASTADDTTVIQEQGSTQAKNTEAEEEETPKNAAELARDAVSIYNSAVKYHLSGKLTEAISEYQAALEANPELSQAHCNLGLIFNQQHNFTKALSEFRKALAIEPKDAITYNGIGAALRAQNDQEGAIKNWKTAISLDPRLATAHYNLGTVYEIQKNYDQALEAYSEAIKNDPRLGEAYYRSGLILVRKNRIDDAKQQLAKSIKVAANAEYSDDARKRLAMLEQTKTR